MPSKIKGQRKLSYIVRSPDSRHIRAGPASLPLILNKHAAKHIIADLKAKLGPTLLKHAQPFFNNPNIFYGILKSMAGGGLDNGEGL